MDDYFSDNSGGSSPESNKWSERAWLDYVRRSEKEIERIANLYDKTRKNGTGFEEVAASAGWPIVYSNSEIVPAEMPEFSKEPLTLINHPIYIVSRAIMRVLEHNIAELVSISPASPQQVWNMARAVHEASDLIMLAVNSTDLGEDMLAHSIYKSAISCLNSALAEIENIAEHRDASANSARDKAITAIFDLRQICLNIS